MDPLAIVALSWMIAAPLFLVLGLISQRRLRRARAEAAKQEDIAQEAREQAERGISDIREKYSHVISQEEEVARLKKEAERIAQEIEGLRGSYAEKRGLLDRLEEKVALYDERLAFAELGVYEPHFDFGDSEAYKRSGSGRSGSGRRRSYPPSRQRSVRQTGPSRAAKPRAGP